VVGFNLDLLMRIKTGYGTPREWPKAWFAIVWSNLQPLLAYLVVVLAAEQPTLQYHPGDCHLQGQAVKNSS
jgi:hypothetical protein